MANKLDPLVGAVINKLPPAGGAFAREQRVNWLKLMSAALGSAYGEVGAIAIDHAAPVMMGNATPTAQAASSDAGACVVGSAPVPDKAEITKRMQRFYIDADGRARRAGGAAILPAELNGDVLYDLRGETGDLAAIIWADGVMGTRGLQLEISAA